MGTDTGLRNRRKTGPGSGEPGPGRPKGLRNKLSQQQLRDARELFLPLLGTVKAMILTHLEKHAALMEEGDIKDCATCRHYVTMVCEYIFGKPTQRHQIDIEEVRTEARRLAREFGLDEEEVVAEAEALVQSGH